MGLKVTTDGKPVTVYRNDKQTQYGIFTSYSLSISSKDKDGNWVNGYIDCQFKKGVDIPNKSKININNSFYTVSEYQGKKYTKIFIMDYVMVEQGEVPKQTTPADIDNWMTLDESQEELPFN